MNVPERISKLSVGWAFFALFICRCSIVSRFDTPTSEAS